MSNKRAGFDEYGNPTGRAFDLGGVEDERLRGEKILLYVGFHSTSEVMEWHHAQAAVAERNIQMDIMNPRSRHCNLTEADLASYTQLWYVSDRVERLNNKQVQMIGEYVRGGNGLLIWADNHPYYADANLLAKPLIGTRFSGNKMGNKIMEPGDHLRPGYFIEHPLTHGVTKLYEGITICTIDPAPDLTILAQSHDKQNCMACFERDKQRIVLDTGYTKLYKGAFTKTAGTARYFRNIAFWLARGIRGIQYTSFTPGRGAVAVISSGGESPRYTFPLPNSGSNSLLLQWEGQAVLGLVVQDEQGRPLYEANAPSSPLRFTLPTGSGSIAFWVKGVQVPHNNFPYVLTMVQNSAPTAAAPPIQIRSNTAGAAAPANINSMPVPLPPSARPPTASPPSARPPIPGQQYTPPFSPARQMLPPQPPQPGRRVFCPNCRQVLNRQTGGCDNCHWREP